jgi:hypothetical protein
MTGANGADIIKRRIFSPESAHKTDVPHSYLPEPVYEALRKIAFDERVKIHDVVLEGIDLALQRRGYPSIVKRARSGKRFRTFALRQK